MKIGFINILIFISNYLVCQCNNQPDTLYMSLSICDSFQWNGNTFLESGTYQYKGDTCFNLAQTLNDPSGYRSQCFSYDGKTIAIGDYGVSGNFVTVYKFLDSVWLQSGNIININEPVFGYSVSLNETGNILAVGSPGCPYNQNCYSNARVFSLINNNWVQIGQTIYGSILNNEFGKSISLNGNGNNLAVGAPGYGNGSVIVYELTNNFWNQKNNVINGLAWGAQCGSSIELSKIGDVLAVPSYDY